MTDEELREQEREWDEEDGDIVELEETDAERYLNQMMTGVDDDGTYGGETLTIGMENLEIGEDPYSTKEESTAAIKQIAESILKVGLLQPPVVVRSNSGFTVVAGRKRIRALQTLGYRDVTCVVRELSDIQQQQATLIENLCRTTYGREAKDKALAKLQELYEIVHPETKKDVIGGHNRTLAGDDAERAKSFARVMAEKEGVHPGTIHASVTRGKKFTDRDRADFVRFNIPSSWQTKLARLESEDERQAILALIRQGIHYKKAGKRVRPDIFGDEGRASVTAPEEVGKAKDKEKAPEAAPSPALTDAEWLASMEFPIRLQVRTEKFDVHAICYRRMQDAVEEVRKALRKYETQANLKGQAGTKYHYPAIVARFLKSPHPKEWLVCGSCNGSGTDHGSGECDHCGATGFVLPQPNVNYWIRFGIRGPQRVES